MNKKKRYNQVIKCILRPEVTHCLECHRRLQRCVTISDRMIITLTQVDLVVHCGYRCPHESVSRQKSALSQCGSRCFGLTWFYLWSGYRPGSRTSPLERASKRSMKFTTPFPSD